MRYNPIIIDGSFSPDPASASHCPLDSMSLRICSRASRSRNITGCVNTLGLVDQSKRPKRHAAFSGAARLLL